MHTLHSDKRKSGIPLIGDLPWGSHFCQFYKTKKDLLDVLVPYFRAGLENNELCVWITSRALGAEDAKNALKKYVSRFAEYVKNGQMEIIPYTRCHAKGEKPGKILVSMLDKAVSSGFDGLRLACCSSPPKAGSKSFTCYGADVVSKYNAIAVFAYPRDRFDAIGLMEVVKNHRFALVRNAGEWDIIESSEARPVKDALKRAEEKLHALFSNMSEGIAYNRLLLDAKGKPCDFVFLEVNHSFERLTGLKGKDIIGKKVTEALPGIENDLTDWIGKFGKVALTGKPEQFESYSEALNKWYAISAFSPHKGYFAVTFSDITERKSYEEELLRSKLEWERTFDSVPYMIAIMDCHHRIVRVNRAMAERVGLVPEQFTGKYCHEVVHGTPEAPGFCPHSQTCMDGKEHTAEVYEPRLNGYFLVSTTPVFNDQGQIIGGVHVARDITGHKRMEEILIQNESRLKRAQEIAHLGSWELDLINNRLYWSDEVYRIFGLQPQEFEASYEAFLEAVHPEDRSTVDAAYSSSLREGRDTYEIEHRVVRKSTGEVRFVHEKCEHIRDGSGRIVRSIGMVHDITEHKQSEEALRSAYARYRSFIAVTGQIGWTTTPAGEVVEDLPEWRNYTGQSFEDIKGWGWSKAIHPDDLAYTVEAWEKSVTEKSKYEIEYRIRRHDGVYRHFMARGTPVCKEDGTIHEWVGTCIDITERKEAEEEREKLLQELTRSNRELEQFAYIASHDLQEPLRTISSYVQLLSSRYKDKLDKDANEFIDYMVTGAAHMRTLLNDLLTYSRAGSREEPFMLTDLNSAIDKALINLKKLIDDSSAEIKHESLPIVHSDRLQMTQLFQNLIGNAIKFHGEDAPRVYVSAERGENEWVIRVNDNGIGINPKYFDRIFHIFKRLHPRERYEGTGIGLAVCKKIVERCGGRIWVESEQGKGSTFYFTIPDRQ